MFARWSTNISDVICVSPCNIPFLSCNNGGGWTLYFPDIFLNLFHTTLIFVLVLIPDKYFCQDSFLLLLNTCLHVALAKLYLVLVSAVLFLSIAFSALSLSLHIITLGIPPWHRWSADVTGSPGNVAICNIDKFGSDIVTKLVNVIPLQTGVNLG